MGTDEVYIRIEEDITTNIIAHNITSYKRFSSRSASSDIIDLSH